MELERAQAKNEAEHLRAEIRHHEFYIMCWMHLRSPTQNMTGCWCACVSWKRPGLTMCLPIRRRAV